MNIDTQGEPMTDTASAFDLWMDEYINNPEAFEREAATIRKHLEARTAGRTPTYGEMCAATLLKYIEKAK